MRLFSARRSPSSFAPKSSFPRPRSSEKKPLGIWIFGLARNDQRCGMGHCRASSLSSYEEVRNIYRMSIGYAFWPDLRDRLTSV